MSVWDVALTIINVILAIISGIGAYNSVKYFRKSKNLTIFAQTNKALVEVQKMLIKLPEAQELMCEPLYSSPLLLPSILLH